ncbi:MAG: S8 family serine peptidase [Candidatus Buchananbacteria bacterium]
MAGEILIKFKNNPKTYLIKTELGNDLSALIKKYQGLKELDYLELNYKFQKSDFPNDIDYYQQWYTFQVKSRDAWSSDLLAREQLGLTRRPIIAVLDSGVYLDHPDLKNKIWKNKDEVSADKIDNDGNGFVDDVNGWNFVDNNSNVNPLTTGSYAVDAVNHGTLVAGIAAAENNNNLGITGMSWSAEIMPLRVLDSQGEGDVYSVIQAIEYAVNNGADVINMSFIGTGYSQALADAIKSANSRGVILVAAAGNTDPKINGIDMTISKSYPVCYNGASGENLVIGVASVGKNLVKSDFSNYGDCVDLVAPGEDMYSTMYFQSGNIEFNRLYGGGWSGTSLAVPLVSATAATIKSLRPNLSAAEVTDYLLSNTKDIYSYNPTFRGKLGSGLLDAGKTIDAILTKPVPKQILYSQQDYLVAALGNRSFPQIKIIKSDGTVFKSFFAYSPNFKGEIFAVSGDVNGDGKEEIITSPGFGGGPHIRVLNIDGQPLAQFFAYDKWVYNGVNVAVGDVNGDGKEEIITGPGKGGKPEVKIFNSTGKLLSSFLAYDNSSAYGVKVATGDVDRDGRSEIITGLGAGGTPLVKVFTDQGKVISQFYAFNQYSKFGVNVACGSVYGDGQPEIIASLGKGNQPLVRLFNYRGELLNSFFVNEPSFLAGINVSAGDINGDNKEEILVGNGTGADATIKALDATGQLVLKLNTFDSNYRGGVRPAAIRY